MQPTMKRHWPIFVVARLAAIAFKRSSGIHARGVEQTTLEAWIETLNPDLTTISDPSSRLLVVSATDIAELQRRAERIHQFRGDVTMARTELERIEIRGRSTRETIRSTFQSTEVCNSPGVSGGLLAASGASKCWAVVTGSHIGNVFLREQYGRH